MEKDWSLIIMKTPIETKRLNITKFDTGMAESVHLNSIDEDNRNFQPDEVFETVAEAAETISELISFYDRRDVPLVYPISMKDGRQIGHVQAVPIDSGWEIGFHIGKAHTRNGYATEAVHAFLPKIMSHLNIKHIYGICRADNAASRKVLERCGFELEFEGVAPYHGRQWLIRRYKYSLNKVE
jgi:RimJ/RimL family protein N-acetyltransferase